MESKAWVLVNGSCTSAVCVLISIKPALGLFFSFLFDLWLYWSNWLELLMSNNNNLGQIVSLEWLEILVLVITAIFSCCALYLSFYSFWHASIIWKPTKCLSQPWLESLNFELLRMAEEDWIFREKKWGWHGKKHPTTRKNHFFLINKMFSLGTILKVSTSLDLRRKKFSKLLSENFDGEFKQQIFHK